MEHNSEFSDYGSGNTSDSSSMSWGGQERWVPLHLQPEPRRPQQRSASISDLITGRLTLEDVMKEFEMNGADCPYTPDDDMLWAHRADELTGMGPSGTYLRQKSWPEPERTPIQPLPTWSPAPGYSSPEVTANNAAGATSDLITEEQLRVLSSLSNTVLYTLLRDLEHGRDASWGKEKKNSEECRFCKNNGERESYYRSHALKDARGRVLCPVLRAFVCKRCGASGDRAHTVKYCPLSTNEERMKSTAMMRSVRMASGRRRAAEPAADCVVGGAGAGPRGAPLHPLWAALEQKLLL